MNDGIYIRVMVSMRDRLHELSGSQTKVLLCIALHWDGDRSWPSIACMQHETGLHPATVMEVVKSLEVGGWISVDRRNGAHNTYQITTNLIQMGGQTSTEKPHRFIPTSTEKPTPPLQKNHTATTTEKPYTKNIPLEEESKKKNSPHSREFVEFWRVYPRKDGKQAAWRKWEARRKERITAAAMTVAAVNYAAYCTAVGTEERFVKHASTFLGPDRHWEEWLEPKAIPKNGKRDIGREAEFDEARRILGLEATG